MFFSLASLAGAAPTRGVSRSDDIRKSIRERLIDLLRHSDVVDYLVEHISTPRCWLMLDGLDEVEPKHRDWIIEEVDKWDCRVVIASRPNTLFRDRATRSTFRLAPLSPSQLDNFVQHWHPNERDQQVIREQIERSPSLRKMATNPFLLTLLYWCLDGHVVDDSLSRGQLIEKALRDMLSLPRDGLSEKDDRRGGELFAFAADVLRRCFESTDGSEFIPNDTLQRHAENSKKRPVVRSAHAGMGRSETPAQQAHHLLDELQGKRLLVSADEQHSVYTTPHRTFIEFLTAEAIARQIENGSSPDDGSVGQLDDLWKFLDDAAWNPAWDQVFVFLAGRLNDSSTLLEMLSDPEVDDSLRHRLGLAGRCIGELTPEQCNRSLPLIQSTGEQVLDQCQGLIEQARFGYFHGMYIPPAMRALPRFASVMGDEMAALLVSKLSEEDVSTQRGYLLSLCAFGRAALRPDVFKHVCRMLNHVDAITVSCARTGVEEMLIENTGEVLQAMAVVLPEADDAMRKDVFATLCGFRGREGTEDDDVWTSVFPEAEQREFSKQYDVWCGRAPEETPAKPTSCPEDEFSDADEVNGGELEQVGVDENPEDEPHPGKTRAQSYEDYKNEAGLSPSELGHLMEEGLRFFCDAENDKWSTLTVQELCDGAKPFPVDPDDKGNQADEKAPGMPVDKPQKKKRGPKPSEKIRIRDAAIRAMRKKNPDLSRKDLLRKFNNEHESEFGKMKRSTFDNPIDRPRGSP